ncbi:hypothetical protein [Saccharolobus caldissimus]|uniref:DNA-binding protein n=1 Tax=Saccharolobus caldissimus TaxID=1702097 RepID=A0AAQ4CTI8_9CREN|nr:hypothetical protein [Saccharolobus caldissimus]BDB99119.1 hypothetical protein SACC_21360 [Saccharolobus caldissimus]
MIAIADTSFIIDWSRFSKKNLLYEIFNFIYLPEPEMKEIKSENTIAWITEGLSMGKMEIFPELSEYALKANGIS